MIFLFSELFSFLLPPLPRLPERRGGAQLSCVVGWVGVSNHVFIGTVLPLGSLP